MKFSKVSGAFLRIRHFINLLCEMGAFLGNKTFVSSMCLVPKVDFFFAHSIEKEEKRNKTSTIKKVKVKIKYSWQ